MLQGSFCGLPHSDRERLKVKVAVLPTTRFLCDLFLASGRVNDDDNDRIERRSS